MTNATLRGKPDAGNPHVRFDEGEVASEKPRRGSLLYKELRMIRLIGLLMFLPAMLLADVAYKSVSITADYSASHSTTYTYKNGWRDPNTGYYYEGKYEDSGYRFIVTVRQGFEADVKISYDYYEEYNSRKKIIINGGEYDTGFVLPATVKAGASAEYFVSSTGWPCLDVGGMTLTCIFTIKVTYRNTAPDLSIEQVKASPSVAAVGEEVTLSYVVKNRGGVKSAATTSSVYDGEAKICTNQAIPAIAAGGSHDVRLSLGSQEVGTHALKICVEKVDGEINVDNNVSSVSVLRYKREPVIVCFDANGGVGGETRSVMAGSSIGSFPAVHKDGYALVGWSSKADGTTFVSADEKVFGQMTLFAIWKKIMSLSIKFDANGGGGEVHEMCVADGESFEVPSLGYSRSKGVCVGWGTAGGSFNAVGLASGTMVSVVREGACWRLRPRSGGDDILSIGENETTLTLYAVWGSEVDRFLARTENATNLVFVSSGWGEYDVADRPFNGGSGCTNAFRSNPDLDSWMYVRTITKFGGTEYSGTNWLAAVVYGPGELSFTPGTSCTATGSLAFSIDGERRFSVKGCGGITPSYGITWYARRSYKIPEGRHLVCWTFVADEMIKARASYNGVWVGDVKWNRSESNNYVVRYYFSDSKCGYFEQAVGFGFVSALLNVNVMFCSGYSDKRFAGWRCSNGRRYDDGMLVFNLAQPGETVTMTAIWE